MKGQERERERERERCLIFLEMKERQQQIQHDTQNQLKPGDTQEILQSPSQVFPEILVASKLQN